MNTDTNTARNINASRNLDVSKWPKADLIAQGYIRPTPVGYVWTKTGEPYLEVERVAACDTEGGAA